MTTGPSPQPSPPPGAREHPRQHLPSTPPLPRPVKRGEGWGEGAMKHYSERSRDRARNLRRADVDAEQRLWRHLRARSLDGHKFCQQHPIGPYFVDFLCLSARLIVELNGSQHVEQAACNAERTRFLESEGFTVWRFWDNDVLRDPAAVLEAIRLGLLGVKTLPLTSALSPSGGEAAPTTAREIDATTPAPRMAVRGLVQGACRP